MALRAKSLPTVSMPTPLRRVCDGVYVMDGSFHMFWSMHLHARMTVLVLPGNQLLVYSPLPPHLVDADALRALGTVKYVVAPNHMHKSFAPSFAAAHEGSKLYCSPSLYETLKAEDAVAYGEKLEYGSASERIFGSTVAVRVLENFKPFREIIILHRPSRTLLVGDLAFNLGAKEIDAFSSPMLKLFLWLLDGYRCLSLTNTFRLLQKKSDVANLVPELEDAMRSLDFDRVIPCHGGIVETAGKDCLKAGTLHFFKDIASPTPRNALTRRALFGAVFTGAIALVVVLAKKK